MPEAAPVTNAVFPARSFMCILPATDLMRFDLVSGEAAFGRDRRAVHHARFVGGEEQGEVRDVLRLADSERILPGDVVDAAEANLVAAGKATPDPFGQHDAGADGVDADPLGRV